MTAAQKRVDGSFDTIKGLTDSIVILTGERIDQANGTLDFHCHTLELTVKLRIARVESALMGPIALLCQNASYHVLKAYYHASPGFIAILLAIWAVIQFVWRIIKVIIEVWSIVQEFGLDDILAEHWKWFHDARIKFREKATELSEALGWGADGFLHILHACQGTTDVLGGLLNKDFNWMDADWMVKTGNVLERTNVYANLIRDNPGAALEAIFQGQNYKTMIDFRKWGVDIKFDIGEALEKGKTALQGLSGVADSLAAIQNGMPDVIRENIPSAIWDGIEKFSDVIDEEILPRILATERYLELVEGIFAQHSNVLGNLADKLAHPGTNLLGIDDLPDYARASEQWAIDEVSSRLFGEGVDTDRNDIQGDLDRFEIIDAAARSPLPVLPFMDIETPGRAALQGIVVEPQETWFIGGYDSQL